MKHPTPLRGLALLFLLLAAVGLRASDASVIADLKAADDERVAASIAADEARLNAIFSDDLQYTHSGGKHDTKQSYIAALVAKKSIYTGYDYKEREFHLATADVATMTAHVIITAGDAKAQTPNEVNALAVWRKEGGKWKFYAWQAAKIVPPAAK